MLLQGDEPQINPIDIQKLNHAFKDFHADVINLIFPISGNDISDPNVVKAIVSKSNKIKFFTRAHAPYQSQKGIRQLGMIGFTSDALKAYVNLEMTDLEILESIDMMRFLENDIQLFRSFSTSPILGVDIPSDIKKVESLMSDDSFLNQYQSKYL